MSPTHHSRPRKHARLRHRHLCCETLEERQLLSTVTSFTNNIPQAIKDKGTITSVISVPAGYLISSVTLNINHTRDEDLDVFLIGPDRTRVELFTDVGGTGDNFTGTTLDDRTDLKIASSSAPFSGTYHPEGYLDTFRGKMMQGTWKLEVTDDTRGETGRLNSWSLRMVEASAVSSSFLDTESTMLGHAYSGGVAMSDNGDAMTVWIEGKDQYGRILPAMTMAARYDAAIGKWEAPAILSNTASMDVIPISLHTRGITGDGQGNYLAFWEQFDTSLRCSVWVNRYLAGSGWQGPQAVYETEPSANTVPFPQAAMAYDPVEGVSKGVVAWRVMSASGDPADVMVNRLTNFTANTWSGASLAESNDDANSGSIQVGMAANGDFLLMFSETVAPYSAYHYRQYKWSTGWNGPEGSIGPRPGKLAMNEVGAAIVIWTQSTGTGGAMQLWARRWNGSDWASEAELVSDDPDNAVNSLAVAISDNGEAVVSYSQRRGGTPYYDAYVRSHVGGAWQDIVKVDSEDLGNVISPNITMDDFGNILAAWSQSDGEFNNAWSTKFDRSAAVWSPAAKLENLAFNAGVPLVAANSSGVATVVWGQPDNTLYHIYASRTALAHSAPVSPAATLSGTDAALVSLYCEPRLPASSTLRVRDNAQLSQARTVIANTRELSYTTGASAIRIADDSGSARDNRRHAEVDDLFAQWDSDPLELLSVPDLGQ